MNRENKKLFGKILIADDEQTFREATAQLLQNEGFECDCAKDAEQALEKLSEKTYDLLIADIKMPGNPNLELIKHLAQTATGLSIILVTGYPSQQTAIEAIHLPITAYFVKPVDFAELLQKTRAAVKVSRFYKTVTTTRESLKQWIDELETIELALKNGKYDAFETALRGFIDITTIKIDDTFNVIRQITDLLDDLRPQIQICQVIQCPALAELTKGLEQSIISLKQSRELYKSKQLAQIRAKLEKLLKKLQTN
jgi:DNA-binding NarL/FixJ family response regulator